MLELLAALLRALFPRKAPQTPVEAPPAHDPTPEAPDPRTAFFTAVRRKYGKLKQSQVDGFNALLDAMEGWPIAWKAYGLGTAWHEVDETMQPIKERGGHAYLDKYDTGRLARILGNTPEDDDDGQLYAGRGYIQLTGRANYSKAGAALGVDLIGNPDLALDHDIAAKVMRWGMETGAFTGKKLADYLPIAGLATVEQFKAARRIINGTDKQSLIAGHALAFQEALTA